ncbi:hypothetical protein [Devosia sp.]|uniref:hypothetical protein n=1 Tax=Devosia sp. TaxID=1871048 RepID=UPI002735FE8D|nr:hypothetical protein [Devosia sp.]MDP2779752.1 hypothetical protein [Devosia sp.]
MTKAWYIWVKDSDEGGEIHWGETAGKAKVKARQQDELVQADYMWTDISAKRAPAFDGEARTLTPRDWIEAGYSYPCAFCECSMTRDGKWCEDGRIPGAPVFGEAGEAWCSESCKQAEERFRTGARWYGDG